MKTRKRKTDEEGKGQTLVTQFDPVLLTNARCRNEDTYLITEKELLELSGSYVVNKKPTICSNDFRD